MIINRFETIPASPDPVTITRPQLNNELATKIARIKTMPGISLELWKTANMVLAAVNVSNPPVEVVKDAEDVLYHLNQAATRYKFPEQSVVSDGASKEVSRPVLSVEAREKALQASIAAVQGVPAPVELAGPVSPPLRDIEKATELARQPAGIGAAAVHNTLHPGSPN